ncbi:MAG TPA: AI-2E family transporter [Candidatus Thermoplasmatota archaeon]|nr:AI-2E family transporter [Candidatus Thermoplasmatota archaeon]
MAKEDAESQAPAAPPSAPRRRIALPRQSQLFFLFILGLAFFLTWLVFRDFIIYMVTGVFVAVLALPIDKFWERFFPNRVAAFFTLFSLFFILTVPFIVTGILLYQDVSGIAQDINDGALNDWANATWERVDAIAPDSIFPPQTAEERNQTVAKIVNNTEEKTQEFLQRFAQDMVEAVPRFFIGMTVILFVVYYVLTDGESLVAYLRRATPLPPKQIDFLLGEARRGLRAVFAGQILTSVIQGAVGGVAFIALGLPGAILWSLVMMIFALLPVVGAFLVWIPAGVYLLLTGPLWKGIAMLLWGLIVVSQVDNFVRPKLIGNRADIHPLFVLVGVLGGVAAFGFIGLFLGPVLVGVTLSVLKVWERDYLDPQVASEGAD